MILKSKQRRARRGSWPEEYFLKVGSKSLIDLKTISSRNDCYFRKSTNWSFCLQKAEQNTMAY